MLSTIAAIATAPGEAGIGIVRISGREALPILKKVFRTASDHFKEGFSPRRLYLGYIENCRGQIIDQVLAAYMPGPFSYTGEDVVEINSHGGALVTAAILELILGQGAVLAEPGEFTKRAFINGKMDLMQAEAVIDLIQAKSEAALRQAGKHLQGQLSGQIEDIRGQIVELLAQCAAVVDFPEHDIPELSQKQMLAGIEAVLSAIERLLETSFAGRVLREGLQVAIVGRPNVGKSSLLNALVGRERAIVTDIAGTTRDVIDEFFSIEGIPIRLLDTAGQRPTLDPVEKIGVSLAEKTMREADLVLVILDQSEPLTAFDHRVLEMSREQRRFIIRHKADLMAALTSADLKVIEAERVFMISSLRQEGLQELRRALANFVWRGSLPRESVFVANARQEQLLRQAGAALQAAAETTASGWPLDMAQIDLQSAYDRLGEMLGVQVGLGLAEEIFGRFCIGK